MSVLVVIAAVLLGCALAYRFGRLTGTGPMWAQVLLVVGSGIGLGIGFTAVLFFLARAFVPVPLLAPLMEVAVGAWLAWEVFRMPKPVTTPGRGELDDRGRLGRSSRTGDGSVRACLGEQPAGRVGCIQHLEPPREDACVAGRFGIASVVASVEAHTPRLPLCYCHHLSREAGPTRDR
jgi:hypothetical protein